ncbi:MAG: putative beta-lactamase class penicillin binding protein [Candidatus Aminicenantes bacterium]|nr:putative beta-lactamase class penicillin binding protein [Candidatus Aminicenantes bacterium]
MRKTFAVFFILILATHLGFAQQPSLASNPEVLSQFRLLEKWIEAQMEYRGLPGLSIGIVFDQNLIWAKGYGRVDLEKKTSASPSSIYRIASITKLFTTTALMQLRDQGKLRLDDPVSKYLPWFAIKNTFPDAPPITIEHLITHTSGLPRESPFPYWTDHIFPTREEMISALKKQETVFPSEIRWKYSNLAMALAGEVVVAASGEPYEAYIQKHILEPLGMKDTSVYLSEEHKKRLVTGYGRRLPDGSREIISFIDSKGITPAANMSSTVEDLAKFISLQFRLEGKPGGSQVLKGTTLREMQRVHWLQPSWKSGQGLGFSIDRMGERTIIGHGGWVGGYRTQIGFCPDEKIGVIVLTNADDGEPWFFLEQIFSLAAPAILKASQPPAEPAKPSPSWEIYLGRYEDPAHFDTEIMIIGGRLVMYGFNYPPERNPEGSLIELTPGAEHTFRMTGENGDGEWVVFELGPDGKVKRIKTGENYIYPKREGI